MKKLAILLLLASCLFSNVVFAGDYPVLSNQVETRRMHLEWILTLQEISMEAVVEYIDEISDGKGTAEIEALLSDFSDMVDEISMYDTHVGLNNYLRALRDITTDFRKETRERMSEYDGKGFVLLLRIGERISENSEMLEALRNQYWNTRKLNVLENFDIRVERAQFIIDLLQEKGYEVTEAQAKLDEINALRDDLEAALEDADNLEILDVSMEALRLSKELAEIVRNLQVDVPPKRVLRHWVNIGEKVLERTGIIIDELKSLDIDTDELEEIHGEAENHQAEAAMKLDEGDIQGTLDALQELINDLIELKEAYLNLVFPEGVPEEIEDVMDVIGEKLEEAAKNMEESIETL